VRPRVATLVGIGALQLLSCGSDLPPCATANCELPGRTIVKWTLDAYPELLFPNDTCQDMGANTMRVDMTGVDDPTQFATKDTQCGQGQVSFLDLAPGNYNVALVALDAVGNPIVKSPTFAQVLAGSAGADTDVTLNVPYDSWTGTYTGTLLFRLSWAGMSCEAAVPPVATQNLTLTAGGVVSTARTDMGQKLDGTQDKPCRLLTEQFAQFAEMLPFGPATLVVVGKDAGDTIRFVHQFDTFVGATKNNPTITYDVPGPDAGVDAPID